MASIVIRVNGIDVDTASTYKIVYDVFPMGGSVLQGVVTVPFVVPVATPEDSLNFGIIGSAKATAAAHGFMFGDSDSVWLLGGVLKVPQSTSPAPQLAHVVMRGNAVDSAFVGTEAEGAARARADALAEATDGMAQDDARKAAPWIATAPVNPT